MIMTISLGNKASFANFEGLNFTHFINITCNQVFQFLNTESVKHKHSYIPNFISQFLLTYFYLFCTINNMKQ